MKHVILTISALAIIMLAGCSKHDETVSYTHDELAEVFPQSGLNPYITVQTVLTVDGEEDKSFSDVDNDNQVILFCRAKDNTITLHFGLESSPVLEFISAPLILGGTPELVTFKVSDSTPSKLRYKSKEFTDVSVKISGIRNPSQHEGNASFHWVLNGHSYSLETVFTGMCIIDRE